jgi:hypothetical protein
VSALKLVPDTAVEDEVIDPVTAAVAALRSCPALLPAMAACNEAGAYAAVIIPSPRHRTGGGQYRVIPSGNGWLVKWYPRDGRPVTVDQVDSPKTASLLILDHLEGLYP